MPFNKETFLDAAFRGDVTTLQTELQQEGADVNVYDNFENQNYAIILAAGQGHTQAVKLLIEKRAMLVVQAQRPKVTALLAAINNGHRDVVQLLLEQDENIALDAKNENGDTALHLALQKNDQALAIKLIAKGADPFIENKAKQVAANHPLLADYLIQYFCPSRFIQAAARGDLKSLQEESVKKDFNVNTVNASGDTALFLAAQNGHEAVVDFLILNKININRQAYDGYTAIKIAAEKDKPQVVRRLVAAGADLESQYQALKQSLINGWSPETAKYLINEVGLDVNHQYTYGESTISLIYWLFWGGQLPSKELLNFLLEKGAKDKGLALRLAAKEHDKEYVEIILKHGAKVNERDLNYGDTALMWAVNAGQFENILCLLAQGADPFIKNKKGETALDLANPGNYQEFKENKKGYNTLNICRQFQAQLDIREALLQPILKRKKSWRKWEIAGAVVTGLIGALCAGFAAVNYFGLSAWLGSTAASFIATLSMPLWINFALLGVGAFLLITAVSLGITAIVNKISSNTLEKQLVPINQFNEEIFIDALTFQSSDKELMSQRREVLRKQLHNAKQQVGKWYCRDFQEGSNYFCPLVYAASMGDATTVAGLLDAGDYIENSDNYGNTALAYAVHGKHDEVVKLLLQRGAIIDASVERVATKSSPAIQKLLQDEKVKRATPADVIDASAYQFGFQQPASAVASDEQALLANSRTLQP